MIKHYTSHIQLPIYLLLVCFTLSISIGKAQVGIFKDKVESFEKKPFQRFEASKVEIEGVVEQFNQIYQGGAGIVYLAAPYSLISYDGERYTVFPIPKEKAESNIKWALYNARNNHHFVSGPYLFGCFAGKGIAKLQYINLIDSLPEAYRNIQDVTDMLMDSQGTIYLNTNKALLKINLSQQRYEVLQLTPFKGRLFMVNDVLHGVQKDKGLVRFTGGLPIAIDQTHEDLNNEVAFIKIINPNYWSFFTKSNQLIIYKNGTYTTTVELSVLLGTNAQIADVDITPNNTFMVGTRGNGIFEIDSAGQKIAHLTKADGALFTKGCLELFVDKENGVWVDGGGILYYVNYDSPLSKFGRDGDFEGIATSLVNYKNKLYIASNLGIYIKQDDVPTANFKGFKSFVWNLYTHDSTLWVCSVDGLFTYNGQGQLKRITNTRVREVHKVPGMPNHYLFVTGTTLEVWAQTSKGLQKKVTWSNLKAPPRRAFLKKNFILYWSPEGITYRLTWQPNSSLQYTQELQVQGLPETINVFKEIKGRMYAGAPEGLFKINLPLARAEQDKELGQLLSKDDIEVFKIVEDNEGKIHIAAYPTIYVFNQNDEGVWELVKDFRGEFPRAGYRAIYADRPSGLMWYAGNEGFFGVNPRNLKNNYRYLNTYLRELTIGGETKWYNPNAIEASQTGGETIPKFAFTKGFTELAYGAIHPYPGYKNIRYEIKLEPLHSTWQEAEFTLAQQFANLQPDEYTFRVRCMIGNDGQPRTETSFTFIITPPWYRTLFAYISYVLIVIGLIVVSVFSYTRRLRRAKVKLEQVVLMRTSEISQQKEEIEAQKEEIEAQNKRIASQLTDLATKNHLIESVNQDLTDSISYARRIQESILPNEDTFKSHFNEAFVFTKPRSIVSGDFFWVARLKDKVLFAVADCTGHGVPGAFLSIISYDSLNNIVLNQGKYRPAEVLTELDHLITDAVNQNHAEDTVKDGLDIALCCYHEGKNLLEFAGAFRPLWLYRKDRLVIIKGNRFSVGRYYDTNEKVFTNHEIMLEAGETAYIFTDGITDQFGGPRDKKFMTSRLKSTVQEVHRLPLAVQGQHIQSTLEKWQGQSFQLDDMLMAGIKF